MLQHVLPIQGIVMTAYHPLFRKISFLLTALACAATVHATDISTVPLNTYSAASSTDVKPNLMFVLDNSGSMAWTYMPDSANDFRGNYGYSSNHCNGVYYNPATTYSPPVKADGTSYPNATFSAALNDGYNTSSTTTDLRTNFQVDPNVSSAPAFYYVYKGTQTAESQRTYYDTSSTFYTECDSTNNTLFIKKDVSTGTSGVGNTDERQNFANWYSYYRTRILMMKTSSGLAFKDIDNKFRVGFMAINNNSGSTNFLNIGDFDSANKATWYDALYGSVANNSTPLRTALSDAGRLYAGNLTSKNGVATTDPVQYSCQQNYTILSTDGFWNGGNGYKLDNSTVGNEDVGLSRPYYDGGSAQLQTRTSTLRQRTGALQSRTKSRGNWGNWRNVATCQPNSSTQCQYNWGSSVNAASCTVNYSSGSGNWTISSGTDCQYNDSSWSNATSCTPVAKSVAPNYTVGTARECQTISSSGGSSDSLADVAAYYYNTDLRSSTASDGTGTCNGPFVDANGVPNSLCDDNVPANGQDVATTQHMTTFTLGLGVRGKMVYSPTYKTDTSGDFYDVAHGTTVKSGICSWQGSGKCNWPIPGSDKIENVDDLWHAAVNGHGTYFSATDPDSLASGLTDALATIINTPRPGTAAAAASSNPNVSANDNYVFSSSYKSVEWYGELIRQQITAEGALTAQNWSAMKLLDCATTAWAASTNYVVGSVYKQGSNCYAVNNAYSSGATFGSTDTANTAVINVDETAATKVPVTPLAARTVYTRSDASGATLIPFEWASLSATQQGYFSQSVLTYASDTAGLSQFCSPAGGTSSDGTTCLTTAQQTGAAGEALVNFLRGDRSNENTYFRQRVHVLGDIVSSEARYVQTPLFNYSDANYDAFKTLRSSRSGRVYVGSNDGMLHAFDATNGQEAWAYIPSMVLPDIYRLADKNYATKHQFFVDASPETGDICPNANAATPTTCTAAQWKTILVGGLNRGGKGYYALDITDPSVAPKLLWEFTDPNLGYSYGNPKITKLEDGTWVVLLSSGYNNADGQGHLYVVNANTGALIKDISTGVGTAASPSGLARLSAHALEPAINNTSVAAYGGDTFGNLWRFDINGDIGTAGYDAQRLISFTDAGGKAQPITVKPIQATINGKPVVFVGTGRYLGETDVKDASMQSFYAVKDNLDATTYGNPRVTGSNFVQQTLTNGTCPDGTSTTVCIPNQQVRLSTSNAVDWSAKNGWFIDFLTGGERSSTDPSLALGTLLFTTITPQASSVSACGASTDTSASFVYALDYLSGGAVNGANGVSGISLGSSLVTRPVMIEQADGTVRALIRTSSGASSGTDLGTTIVLTPPVKPPSSGGTRRVSWRILNAK